MNSENATSNTKVAHSTMIANINEKAIKQRIN